MSDSTDQLLLAEIRALREDFHQFARELTERVSVAETQLHTLVGNGQPGRVRLLEMAVESLKQWRWKTVGMAAGASSVICVIAWLVQRGI
jgi:hypothetical protein